MRKYFFVTAIFASLLVLVSFTRYNQPQDVAVVAQKAGLLIPDDIQQVIDNSCYGCHHTKSKATKAKAKLNFDKLGKLKLSKQVAKLSHIADVLKDDDMPPRKFLEKHPEKALTADQKKLMLDWAESTANNLVQ